jgi:hypothetical protein
MSRAEHRNSSAGQDASFPTRLNAGLRYQRLRYPHPPNCIGEPPLGSRAVSFDKVCILSIQLAINIRASESHELLTFLMPKIECQLNTLLIFYLLNP